jgi:hypothetical protein
VRSCLDVSLAAFGTIRQHDGFSRVDRHVVSGIHHRRRCCAVGDGIYGWWRRRGIRSGRSRILSGTVGGRWRRLCLVGFLRHDDGVCFRLGRWVIRSGLAGHGHGLCDNSTCCLLLLFCLCRFVNCVSEGRVEEHFEIFSKVPFFSDRTSRLNFQEWTRCMQYAAYTTTTTTTTQRKTTHDQCYST